MASIRHRVGIVAPLARVYAALATTEGLKSWWTRDTEGDPNEGGTLRFYFGETEPSASMTLLVKSANNGFLLTRGARSDTIHSISYTSHRY